MFPHCYKSWMLPKFKMTLSRYSRNCGWFGFDMMCSLARRRSVALHLSGTTRTSIEKLRSDLSYVRTQWPAKGSLAVECQVSPRNGLSSRRLFSSALIRPRPFLREVGPVLCLGDVEKRSTTQCVCVWLIVAGIAGCCAKSTTAPLDRLKILVQAKNIHYLGQSKSSPS